MKVGEKETGGKNASLVRAKRLFLVNSALFVCLMTIAAFLLFSGEEESVATPDPPPPEKEWSLPELAYLKGEMQALKEHPGTMPEYEEEWVKKHAEQAIRRDREFDGIDEMTAADLAEEYLRGYTNRFTEYYETRAAREFGYEYGVKFNPDIHGLFPRSSYGALRLNRDRIEQTFNIPDEATWRLFFEAFDSGFVQGYRVIKKGVTVESPWDKITLFNER